MTEHYKNVVNIGTGALSGKMLLASIVENDKIYDDFRVVTRSSIKPESAPDPKIIQLWQ